MLRAILQCHVVCFVSWSNKEPTTLLTADESSKIFVNHRINSIPPSFSGWYCFASSSSCCCRFPMTIVLLDAQCTTRIDSSSTRASHEFAGEPRFVRWIVWIAVWLESMEPRDDLVVLCGSLLFSRSRCRNKIHVFVLVVVGDWILIL